MASEFTLTGRARLLVAALGLSLAAILVASLVERFTSKGLTVRHPAPQSAGAPAAEGSDEVGRLMQEVARNPGNKAVLVQIAERLMSMGSWDGAESFATRALALDPQDGRTRYLLGVIRHNQGRHADAAKLLEEALQNGESAPMRYSLGVLYLHYLNDPARGVEHLSRALHAPDADESLRQSIREELEKAPLPEAEGQGAEAAPKEKGPAPGAGGEPVRKGGAKNARKAAPAAGAAEKTQARPADRALASFSSRL